MGRSMDRFSWVGWWISINWSTRKTCRLDIDFWWASRFLPLAFEMVRRFEIHILRPSVRCNIMMSYDISWPCRFAIRIVLDWPASGDEVIRFSWLSETSLVSENGTYWGMWCRYRWGDLHWSHKLRSAFLSCPRINHPQSLNYVTPKFISHRETM